MIELIQQVQGHSSKSPGGLQAWLPPAPPTRDRGNRQRARQAQFTAPPV